MNRGDSVRPLFFIYGIIQLINGIIAPVASPATSVTLIYVTISPVSNALTINSNAGNAGDTGFVGLVDSTPVTFSLANPVPTGYSVFYSKNSNFE